tara:strand:+ start:798 stop:1709 length:912 start_codon:yes stop_codon:yes gene_type:complete
VSGTSKKGFDAPPISFPAFKKSSSGASRGNWVTSSKVRIVTSTYTYQYPYYASKPKTPQRNIWRRIQIGDFSINKGDVDNNNSKKQYEIYGSYVKNQGPGPSSYLSIEAYKVPRKYQTPKGEEFEEWRQNNGSKITLARYCDSKCNSFEAEGYNYTKQIETFKSKLQKSGLDKYVDKCLNESLKDNFFIPPSLDESSVFTIAPKIKFTNKLADKITGFNPSIDTLKVDTKNFGIDRSARFAGGMNRKVVKKNLAKLDIDFLYDEKKGGLYFNENGAAKGFGEGGIVAMLKGAPDLTSGNLELI